MKIYLDLVTILNFSFDFLLLLSVSILLKRNIKLYRLFLSALFGSFSIFLIFIKLTSLQLFLLKMGISFIMILIVFGYKNLKYTLKNIIYFYILGFILGGFLYFLNVQFSYKNKGIVFFHKGLSVNYIFLLIFSPIILYIYIKQNINFKKIYKNYYKVKIYYNNKIFNLIGYLDTGNNLLDPIKKRPVILINPNIITEIPKSFFIPFQSSNGTGIIKCFQIDKIEIETIGSLTNVMLGVMKEKINIDGVDCLLNNILMEDKDD